MTANVLYRSACEKIRRRDFNKLFFNANIDTTGIISKCPIGDAYLNLRYILYEIVF